MKKISTCLSAIVGLAFCCLLFSYTVDLLHSPVKKDVVIIDKSLENYQELVASSDKSALVILVDNTDSGFTALEKKISLLHGIERLHILTHGTSGNFVLGRQQLNEQNLDKFKNFWQAIDNSLASEKSELLIYSCQLASGEAGKSFVNRLHSLLGVDVAASEDNTGAIRRGGNWELEYVAGNVAKDHVLEFSQFQGLLIPYFSALEGSSSPFDAMKIFGDDQLIYGDFDADGDIDIHLYPLSGGTENQFWQNNGSGSFAQVTGAANPFNGITEKSAFYGARYAYVADWDNDGDDDILVTKRSATKQNIFYKNNSGVYQEITGASSPFAQIGILGDDQIIFGDFDLDGDIDIHSNAGGTENDFWQNNGSGQFSKVTGSANPFRNLPNTAAFYTSATFARVADWDNDGDDDIFVTKRTNVNSSGENIFFRNDAGTFVQLSGASSPFKNISIVQDNQFIYGDFDSDGDIDIQASSSNSVNTLKFWQNNGSGGFTDVTGPSNPFNNIPNAGTFFSSATYAFVADWDNDKDADVFVTKRTATDQNILFVQADAPPLLNSSTPANAATGVAVEGNLVLNFSRAVSPVSGKNIVIKRTSDNSIFATIPVTNAQVTGGGSSTITINPTSDLEGTKSFYLFIDKGAFADNDGRIFAGINSKKTLAFTTGAAPVIPTINTSAITTFNTNSATMGGTITNDGGASITERGVVWSTSTAPTTANNKTIISSSSNTFSQSISSLPGGTRIFVRAYARNSVGIAYGNEVDFYTKTTVVSITRASASPTNATIVLYTVTFANNVTDVNTSCFSLTSSGLTGAAIGAVSGSGTTYTVAVNTGAGNGTVRLDFTGTAITQPAVENTFTTADAYNVYKTSTAANYYRTKLSDAAWNQSASWESSPDNSFWISATNFPNASTATVNVLPGQTIALPAGFNSSTGNLSNSGVINLNANSLTASGTFVNTGTLKGTGTFVNSNLNNTGTIAPGNSPGTLSFTGNLASSGIVNIEIGGTTAGTGYDQILVSGTMTISGTLNVTFINGFTPVLGDAFTIVDAAASTGNFQTTNLPDVTPRIWEKVYNDAAGTLTLRVINDPLPVKLVSFDAGKKENLSVLSWATSEETNSSHFEIERSTPDLQWKTIGTLAALTESTSLKKYEFIDADPASGENLYRLKMVDIDGTFAYSKIRSVIFDAHSVKVSVFPNPVTERLFLDVKETGIISDLTIYNTIGVAVTSEKSYTTDGISVRDLPAGLYVLKITKSGNQSIIYKFFKN